MTEQGFEEVLSPHLYFDREHNVEAAKILPGEYYATGRDMVLVTVLGSCVCACIRDRTSGIGGMNHFMLPESGQDRSNPLGESARYGAYAMEILINQLLKMGAVRSNFEAKVFGGASVLRGFTVNNVGNAMRSSCSSFSRRKNSHHRAGFAQYFPRKVYFFPASGLVRVKNLKQVHNDTIITAKPSTTHACVFKLEGEVELFD